MSSVELAGAAFLVLGLVLGTVGVLYLRWLERRGSEADDRGTGTGVNFLISGLLCAFTGVVGPILGFNLFQMALTPTFCVYVWVRIVAARLAEDHRCGRPLDRTDLFIFVTGVLGFLYCARCVVGLWLM